MVKKLPLTRRVSSTVLPAVLERAELALVSGGVESSAPARERYETAMAVIGNLR